MSIKGLPRWLSGKESAYNAGNMGSIPGSGEHTPVFLPGKSHGQKSLAGHGSWGHKDSDTTYQLNSNIIQLASPSAFKHK